MVGFCVGHQPISIWRGGGGDNRAVNDPIFAMPALPSMIDPYVLIYGSDFSDWRVFNLR